MGPRFAKFQINGQGAFVIRVLSIGHRLPKLKQWMTTHGPRCLLKHFPSSFQIREDKLPYQLDACAKAQIEALYFREAIEEIVESGSVWLRIEHWDQVGLESKPPNNVVTHSQ